MVEQFGAKIVLQLAGHPDDRSAHEETKDAGDDRQAEHQQDIVENLALRFPLLESIEDQLENVRIDQQKAVGEKNGNSPEDQIPFVSLKVFGENGKARRFGVYLSLRHRIKSSGPFYKVCITQSGP